MPMSASSRFFTLLFLILFRQIGQAQITDDFSDGNFTSNPAWQGDAANFVVSAGKLQLMAPMAGSSVLAVSGTIPDSAVWLFDIRLNFAPSTQNQLRVYLLADQSGLLAGNAYYLEIGETGAQDALRFFRQDGPANTLLATGTLALVAQPFDIQIRMRRSKAGDWSLDAGPVGSSMIPQFTVADATYPGGDNLFFGVYCKYTSTNQDKFYFDNLSVLPDVPDTQAPVLLSALANDDTHVSVFFDENIDSLSAVDATHYSINGGVGQPVSAELLTDKRSVRLTLSAALATGSYTLQSNGIADVSSNVSATQTADFEYIKVDPAAEFDILINEIMATPAPSAGLPNAEWVELYNRSGKTIDLNTLRFDDGGVLQTIPVYLLQPGEYVVLCSATGAAALSAVVANVLAVPSFPLLNNDGDLLTLSTANGLVIDRVGYSVDWHTDSGKKAGGWSLERINPGLPCLGSENWQSCPVMPGGTPGKVNAAFQPSTDQASPRLLSAFPESASAIRLKFSEGLDRNAAENEGAYQLSPARTVAMATLSPGNRSEVLLTLSENLEIGVVYNLEVSTTVADCSGNGVAGSSVQIGLAETPEYLDIVINEILFNPATGGADYVEFYNASGKIFSWQNFYIGNMYKDTVIVPVSLERLFLPGQYDVFSPNPADIKARFSNIHPENVLPLALPSFADDAGNVTLYWSKDGVTVILDTFLYNENMHNGLYTKSDRDGVALERIRTEAPTNLAANWTSASPSVTGAPGTPTLPNSQHLDPGDPGGNDLIQLPQARLSPDGDGYEDFLDIFYTLPETGYTATMNIYDSDGIPVKRLVRRELLGTEGSLRWDGDSDDGAPARPGIYILSMEIFSARGDVQRVKKTFALVKRF